MRTRALFANGVDLRNYRDCGDRVDLVPTMFPVGDIDTDDPYVFAFHRPSLRVSGCVTLFMHTGSATKCPACPDWFLSLSKFWNCGSRVILM
jgi:hypothetical protein